MEQLARKEDQPAKREYLNESANDWIGLMPRA